MKKLKEIIIRNKLFLILPVILVGFGIGLLNNDQYKVNKQIIALHKSIANIDYKISVKKTESYNAYQDYLKLRQDKKILENKLLNLINSGSIPVSLDYMSAYNKEHYTGPLTTGNDGLPVKKVPQAIGLLNFLKVYNLEGTYQHWIDMGEKYHIDPAVPVCIAFADTNMGRALASKNNLGNVGNNDRGNRVAFNSIEQGIEHIFLALNNKYLGSIQSIGGLSCGGRKALFDMNIIYDNKLCGKKGVQVYATSERNRNKNVINCLKQIKNNKNINENFRFRK